MDGRKTLTIYLEEAMRRRAQHGKVNFINRIVAAFDRSGFRTAFRGDSNGELQSSEQDPGYSLFFMKEPFHERALSVRLSYYYPFWRIGRTARRWKSKVAVTPFEPSSVDQAAAENFARVWRRKYFGNVQPRDDGFILVPLQGRLLDHRSFQSMSPIEMLRETSRCVPEKEIVVTLHPKERYTPEETRALQALERSRANITISDKISRELVPCCSCVVTQNSAVAVAGYFFQKPAILFSRIDFHHIAANILDLGCDEAFRCSRNMKPDYEKYLFWFFQEMSINAGRPEAEDKILSTVRALGWDV